MAPIRYWKRPEEAASGHEQLAVAVFVETAPCLVAVVTLHYALASTLAYGPYVVMPHYRHARPSRTVTGLA
jgi:hypothetical protein